MRTLRPFFQFTISQSIKDMNQLVPAATMTPSNWTELCRGLARNIFEMPGGNMMTLTQNRAELTGTPMQVVPTSDV